MLPIVMDDSLTPAVAHAFPGYRLEKLVGSGGAGRVYLAVALATSGRVAVKVFHAHRVNRPEFARRFDREVALSRTLDHPGVVRLLDQVTGTDGTSVALVMEYVAGQTLRGVLKAGALPPKVAIEFAFRIADILAYVHRKGVAHLDLKPENVLVLDLHTVRLMDFGISQATHGQLLRDGMKTRAVAGTPHYMAPEQFSGEGPLDHRADLYSLGVILHEMLTGDRPSGGVLPLAGLTPIDLRQDTVALLGRLLAVDPALRYQIAADVAEKLRGLMRRAEADEQATLAARRAPPVSRPEAPGRATGCAPPAKPPRTHDDAGSQTLLGLLFAHPWIPIALAFFSLLITFYHLVDYAFTH